MAQSGAYREYTNSLFDCYDMDFNDNLNRTEVETLIERLITYDGKDCPA